MEKIIIYENITILNDTYNSNFEALKSALKTVLKYTAKRKIAVLGDILELEDFSEEIHRQIGALKEIHELDALFLRGENAKFIKEEALKNGVSENKIFYFNDNKDLAKSLQSYIKKEDVILIKASHGMNFKEIISELERENK